MNPPSGYGLTLSATPDPAATIYTCEHMFLTAPPHAHVRFRRAIERRALWIWLRTRPASCHLPLEDALQLVHLYAERGSPEYKEGGDALARASRVSPKRGA